MIKLLRDAMNGKPRAFARFVNLMIRAGLLPKDTSPQGGRVIFFPRDPAFASLHEKLSYRKQGASIMKPTKSAPGHDDEVGYGKPPKANRFRKGQSGNPKGAQRVRSENVLPIFKRLAMKRVKVNIDGAVKTLFRGGSDHC